MPSDTEMIARLTYIATHADAVCITIYEQAAIRWAVKRLGELEWALKRAELDSRHCGDAQGICYDWCPACAVLSPVAPAKEGEAKP